MNEILVYLIAAVAAGICVGAVGFADAVLANAVFALLFGTLGAETTLAIVAGGSVAYPLNLFAIRERQNLICWERQSTFWWLTVCGLVSVIPATFFLVPVLGGHVAAVNRVIGGLLLVVCSHGLFRKQITISERFAAQSTPLVGLLSGVLGAVSGLSGVFTTLWAKANSTWSQPEARGVYQPFVAVMHITVLVVLLASSQVPQDPTRIIVYVAVSGVAMVVTMFALNRRASCVPFIETAIPGVTNGMGIIAAVTLIWKSM
jgi:hypothetical protein